MKPVYSIITYYNTILKSVYHIKPVCSAERLGGALLSVGSLVKRLQVFAVLCVCVCVRI